MSSAAPRLTPEDLVRIANTAGCKEGYLRGVPQEIVDAVDLALTFESVLVPVHKYLIMANSPIFREVLGSQVAGTTEDVVLELPLVDDEEECVRNALQFMYQKSCFSMTVPNVQNMKHAEQLVSFGRKYNIKMLLDEGDVHIHLWLKANIKDIEDAYDG